MVKRTENTDKHSTQKFHPMHPALAAVLGLGLVLLPSAVSAQVQSLRLVIRAFIPNEHPSNPGYIRPVPGSPASSMIPGPGIPYVSNNPLPYVGSCYNTNDRKFSTERTASSKLESGRSFVWNALNSTYDVGDHTTSTGVTRRFNCETGLTECRESPKNPTIESTYAIIGETININVSAAASNPCIKLIDIGDYVDSDAAESLEKEMEGKSEAEIVNEVASRYLPKINWSGVFQINAKTGTVRFIGTIADFPSYEAYLYVDNQPITIFKESPKSGSTAWSLLTSRQIDVQAKFTPLVVQKVTIPEIPAPPSIVGTWRGAMHGVNHTVVFRANGTVTKTNYAGSDQGTWSKNGSAVTVQIRSRVYRATVTPQILQLQHQAPAGVVTATLTRQ